MPLPRVALTAVVLIRRNVVYTTGIPLHWGGEVRVPWVTNARWNAITRVSKQTHAELVASIRSHTPAPFLSYHPTIRAEQEPSGPLHISGERVSKTFACPLDCALSSRLITYLGPGAFGVDCTVHFVSPSTRNGYTCASCCVFRAVISGV